MNGFDYIKVSITESINRGRRKYINPDQALKAQRRISREMGLDPDEIRYKHRQKMKMDAEAKHKSDKKEEKRKKDERIKKYLSNTSKRSRIKMILTHPQSALAARKLSKDIKKRGAQKDEDSKGGSFRQRQKDEDSKGTKDSG